MFVLSLLVFLSKDDLSINRLQCVAPPVGNWTTLTEPKAKG